MRKRKENWFITILKGASFPLITEYYIPRLLIQPINIEELQLKIIWMIEQMRKWYSFLGSSWDYPSHDQIWFWIVLCVILNICIGHWTLTNQLTGRGCPVLRLDDMLKTFFGSPAQWRKVGLNHLISGKSICVRARFVNWINLV